MCAERRLQQNDQQKPIETARSYPLHHPCNMEIHSRALSETANASLKEYLPLWIFCACKINPYYQSMETSHWSVYHLKTGWGNTKLQLFQPDGADQDYGFSNLTKLWESILAGILCSGTS